MSDHFLPLFFEKKSFKRFFAGMFDELHCIGIVSPTSIVSIAFGLVIVTLGVAKRILNGVSLTSQTAVDFFDLGKHTLINPWSVSRFLLGFH